MIGCREEFRREMGWKDAAAERRGSFTQLVSPNSTDIRDAMLHRRGVAVD